MIIKTTLTVFLTAICITAGYAQIPTDRLKVYIKVESGNEDKIVASLRRELKPYKEYFLFVFPGAQIENNPDLVLIVKEGSYGALGVFYPEQGQEFYCCSLNTIDRVASDIFMRAYLRRRVLEVGEDQAHEEFQATWQEAYEKVKKQRELKKKKGANKTRSRAVTKQ